MLAPLILFYLMCMPMGYVVGTAFVRDKVSGQTTTPDREKAEKEYSFIPIMSGLILPFGVLLAFQQIMKGL